MSAETAIAEQQRQLSALAELSLAMAQKLEAATLATDDTGELVRLAGAFAKVSRCLRMSIALSMRLTRGEAPARRDRAGHDRDLEADDDEDDFDEDEDFDDERPERFDERENLYDRLPKGGLPIQIATIARTLAAAARAFPGPVADTYRARCEAIAADAAADLARPPGEPRELVAQAAIPAAADQTPPRARGPPRLS